MKRSVVKKTVVYILVTLVSIAILSGGYLWYSVHRTMEAMYEPLPSAKWVNPIFETEPEPEASAVIAPTTSETVIEPSQSPASQPDNLDEAIAERLLHPDLTKEDPFSMLILGVDERASDRGRSDTMILLTVQPKEGSAIALSIPRDTRVLMPDTGRYDKINHAYAYGGSPLAVKAVEQLFGVPIAYYMKTNMDGLVSIVDTLGGVDLHNPRAFRFGGTDFPVGALHLNGKEALAYSRMRKEDPQGDIGRTERQRLVLSGAVDKIASLNSITKLPSLLSHLSKYVRTNLTSQNMMDLASRYRSSIHQVETLTLPGEGQMINGIYYYAVTPQARRNIRTELLEHLNAS